MQNKIVFDHSILESLPDPRPQLDQLMCGINHPKKKCEVPNTTIKTIGGLHNLSTSDKLRWGKDNNDSLLIIETGSDRCEFYPQATEFMGPYRIQVVSFINTKKELIVSSHYRYHCANAPEPAVVYIPKGGSSGPNSEVIKVWISKGRMESRDFWNVDADCHNYNVEANRYVYTVDDPDHYINTIIFGNLTEKWKDNQYVETNFETMQIVLRNPKTPEAGDPTTGEWIRDVCKHRFFPQRDEPFEDETDEFRFLTDMAW